MTYIIDPKWIYWMSVVDYLKYLGEFICVVSGFALLTLLFLVATDGEYYSPEQKKKSKKAIIICSISLCVAFIVAVFLPNKEVMTEMLIAKTATVENIRATGETAQEFIDHIIDKIKE